MGTARALEYGTCYHIFNRGNNGEDIFLEERNYSHFLALCSRYILPVAEIYAYCLLRNHFHLLIRTRTEAEQLEEQDKTFGVSKTPKVCAPSRAFSHWFNAYAKAINQAYGRTGSLFERPFERVPVDSDVHLTRLVVYIHRNPERHGLVGDFRDWPHSSYRALRSTQVTHVSREDVLDWFGGVAGLERAHEGETEVEESESVLLEDVW